MLSEGRAPTHLTSNNQIPYPLHPFIPQYPVDHVDHLITVRHGQGARGGEEIVLNVYEEEGGFGCGWVRCWGGRGHGWVRLVGRWLVVGGGARVVSYPPFGCQVVSLKRWRYS